VTSPFRRVGSAGLPGPFGTGNEYDFRDPNQPIHPPVVNAIEHQFNLNHIDSDWQFR